MDSAKAGCWCPCKDRQSVFQVYNQILPSCTLRTPAPCLYGACLTKAIINAVVALAKAVIKNVAHIGGLFLIFSIVSYMRRMSLSLRAIPVLLLDIASAFLEPNEQPSLSLGAMMLSPGFMLPCR